MVIRRATWEDAGAISELMKELGYEAPVAMIAAKLRRFAQSPHDAAFVATEGDGVIGCISVHTLELFHVTGRLGRITSLVVKSAARRTGVGTALIEAAEQFFRSCGCVRAEVTSGDHRHVAHRFYLASGFREDERRFLKALKD